MVLNINWREAWLMICQSSAHCNLGLQLFVCYWGYRSVISRKYVYVSNLHVEFLDWRFGVLSKYWIHRQFNWHDSFELKVFSAIKKNVNHSLNIYLPIKDNRFWFYPFIYVLVRINCYKAHALLLIILIYKHISCLWPVNIFWNRQR